MSTRLEFLAPGGVVSSGVLRELVGYCNQLGLTYLQAGERQNFVGDFKHPGAHLFLQERLAGKLEVMSAGNSNTFRGFAQARLFPGNIMSSALSQDIENNTDWLSESDYLALLEELERPLNFSLSITDPRQSLCPLYLSEVNLCAAPVQDHWRITLRPAGRKPIFADFYISSRALPEALKFLDLNHAPQLSAANLLDTLKDRFKNSLLPLPENMNSENTKGRAENPADYEGFHEYGEGFTWLGVYNRYNKYSTLLLDEISYYCRRSGIGRLYLTPWHSILIKKIPLKHREEWIRLMNRHGVNLRHGSAALNWRIEGANPRHIKLKNRVISGLVNEELGLQGMSFGIMKKYTGEEINILIEPSGKFPLKRYNLLYKKGFVREGEKWEIFKNGLRAGQLSGQIARIVATYRETFLGSAEPATTEEISKPEPVEQALNNAAARETQNQIYCSDCFNIYDPELGDPDAGVNPGVAFKELAANYCCSLCGSPRNKFTYSA